MTVVWVKKKKNSTNFSIIMYIWKCKLSFSHMLNIQYIHILYTPYANAVLPYSTTVHSMHKDVHTVRIFSMKTIFSLSLTNLWWIFFFQNTLWNHDNCTGPIKTSPHRSSHRSESKYVDCLCLGRTIFTVITSDITQNNNIHTHTLEKKREKKQKRQSHSFY